MRLSGVFVDGKHSNDAERFRAPKKSCISSRDAHVMSG